MTELDGGRCGPWLFSAHVETRAQVRMDPKEPPLNRGDIWFRVVLIVEYEDDDGEHGVSGELATSWLWDVESAATQAKLFKGLLLSWSHYDEDSNKYVQVDGHFLLDAVVDKAVTQFNNLMPLYQ